MSDLVLNAPVLDKCDQLIWSINAVLVYVLVLHLTKHLPLMQRN